MRKDEISFFSRCDWNYRFIYYEQIMLWVIFIRLRYNSDEHLFNRVTSAIFWNQLDSNRPLKIQLVNSVAFNLISVNFYSAKHFLALQPSFRASTIKVLFPSSEEPNLTFCTQPLFPSQWKCTSLKMRKITLQKSDGYSVKLSFAWFPPKEVWERFGSIQYFSHINNEL